MKVNLTLNGKDEKSEVIELQLSKNSLDDETIKIKVSYSEVVINLEELEEAIKYIKGDKLK